MQKDLQLPLESASPARMLVDPPQILHSSGGTTQQVQHITLIISKYFSTNEKRCSMLPL